MPKTTHRTQGEAAPVESGPSAFFLIILSLNLYEDLCTPPQSDGILILYEEIKAPSPLVEVGSNIKNNSVPFFNIWCLRSQTSQRDYPLNFKFSFAQQSSSSPRFTKI